MMIEQCFATFKMPLKWIQNTTLINNTRLSPPTLKQHIYPRMDSDHIEENDQSHFTEQFRSTDMVNHIKLLQISLDFEWLAYHYI